MYLPRGIYELLPYVYAAVGIALCGLSYYGAAGALSDAELGVGIGGILLGLVLILRRRTYRDDAARYHHDSLDE
jgi:hypothetical protein